MAKVNYNPAIDAIRGRLGSMIFQNYGATRTVRQLGFNRRPPSVRQTLQRRWFQVCSEYYNDYSFNVVIDGYWHQAVNAILGAGRRGFLAQNLGLLTPNAATDEAILTLPPSTFRAGGTNPRFELGGAGNIRFNLSDANDYTPPGYELNGCVFFWRRVLALNVAAPLIWGTQRVDGALIAYEYFARDLAAGHYQCEMALRYNNLTPNSPADQQFGLGPAYVGRVDIA